MRPFLIALPFVLLSNLTLAAEHSHDHDHDHHDEHGSLGAHEHGVAELDAALDGSTLELELRTPAMNLVGFEHAPSSDADRRKLADARAHLERPDALFGLPAGAGCTLADTDLESPLFEQDTAHDHDAEHGDHSDIHAAYRYNCTAPDALQALDLSGLFKTFPGTEKIQAQLIGPNGQRGVQLNKGNARASF
ncbi:DUF2796 domain-containing protein [Stutzerimonas marianensis]